MENWSTRKVSHSSSFPLHQHLSTRQLPVSLANNIFFFFAEASQSQPAEKLTNGDHVEEGREEEQNGGGIITLLSLACY